LETRAKVMKFIFPRLIIVERATSIIRVSCEIDGYSTNYKPDSCCVPTYTTSSSVGTLVVHEVFSLETLNNEIRINYSCKPISDLIKAYPLNTHCWQLVTES
jgi:hypothetical protein